MRTLFLCLSLLLSGCAAPPVHRPGDPGPPACGEEIGEHEIRKYQGNGTLHPLTPQVRLDPGQDSTFAVEMVNPDCREYRFSGGCGFRDIVNVGGEVPLIGRDGRLGMVTLFRHSCPHQLVDSVPPGGSRRFAPTWDGGVELWDRRDLEAGLPMTARTLYAAPGTFPVHYGFLQGSYPLEFNGTVEIRQNHLNRDSPYSLDCRALDPRRDRLTEAEVGLSRPVARLGEPVTLYANYTIEFREPGCYLAYGFPGAVVADAKARAVFSLGGAAGTRSCGGPARPYATLVHAPLGRVEVRLERLWDGSAPPESPCPGAVAGHHTVRFQTFERFEFSAEARPPRLNLTWTA